MKRIILSVALIAAATFTLSAQGKVIIESGSLDVLKEKKTALFEADFSEAKVGEDDIDTYLAKLGEDPVKDWPAALKEAEGYFVKDFNSKSDGLQIKESDAVVKADYLISFKVLYYSPGDSKAKNIPLVAKEGGTKLSGYISFIDRKSGKTVCKLAVDEVRGASYPSVAPRIGFSYMAIVKQIFAFIKE